MSYGDHRLAGMTGLTIAPVDAGRLSDLDALFAGTRTTAGCQCLWFIVSAQQCQAGWGEGNRLALAELTRAGPDPVGLLAYRDGEPVGWCAAGPRSRFARALRSKLLAGRDAGEDPDVWLVPCFYVRRDARRAGVTRALLTAAVALARDRGARAVEGFPLSGDGRHPAGEAFLGVEPLFAGVGFTVLSRPSPKRVLMRLSL
jgi:GNAT superfamily N-acetyltransferase